jgi:hypothetical protein
MDSYLDFLLTWIPDFPAPRHVKTGVYSRSHGRNDSLTQRCVAGCNLRKVTYQFLALIEEELCGFASQNFIFLKVFPEQTSVIEPEPRPGGLAGPRNSDRLIQVRTQA